MNTAKRKTAKTMIYVGLLGGVLLASCSTASAMTPVASVAMATEAGIPCGGCFSDFLDGLRWCASLTDDPTSIDICIEVFYEVYVQCCSSCGLIARNEPASPAFPEAIFVVRPSSLQQLFNSVYLASKKLPTANPSVILFTLQFAA
jgi:hypothetical protein